MLGEVDHPMYASFGRNVITVCGSASCGGRLCDMTYLPLSQIVTAGGKTETTYSLCPRGPISP